MKALDLTMAAVVGVLFTTGVHLMLQRSLSRALLGFILLGHGTNLLLLVAGGADPGAPGETPLPQAMALTAIVITFGVTTFLLALSFRSWRLSGHDEVRDDVEDRRIGTVREREDAEPATDVPEAAEDGAEEDPLRKGPLWRRPRRSGPLGKGSRGKNPRGKGGRS